MVFHRALSYLGSLVKWGADLQYRRTRDRSVQWIQGASVLIGLIILIHWAVQSIDAVDTRPLPVPRLPMGLPKVGLQLSSGDQGTGIPDESS